MLYQRALCTTVPQRIKHQDPHAAVECERLEDHAAQSAANHDHTGCSKKTPLYAGQTVSVLNNDRTLWLPATVVHAAAHGSYIIKVIGGAEYRRAQDHIHERHPDAVKPDMHPKVEVAEHPASTPSAAAKSAVPTPTAAVKAPAAPTAQPSVAPATTMQAAARSPTAAAHTQQKTQTPACADVKQTGSDVAPCQSARTIKAPQRLIEQMYIQPR